MAGEPHNGIDGANAAAADVPASLLRVAKFGGDRPAARDWSLYLFFRILSAAELESSRERLLAAAGRKDQATLRSRETRNKAVQRPDLQPDAEPDPQMAPAPAFLAWLRVLCEKDGEALASEAQPLMTALDGARLPQLSRLGPVSLGAVLSALQSPDRFDPLRCQVMAWLRETAEGAGDQALLPLLAHEFLRQAAPSFASDGGLPVIRSEVEEDRRKAASESRDNTPITFAFTHAGLLAAGVDRVTVQSFPDVFKEGMAARAHRLGDTGPSAPENWDGALGLRSVHGFFTGGFQERGLALDETYWRRVRRDIRAFNAQPDEAADGLRRAISVLFGIVGIEILHIELGQDPQHWDKDKKAYVAPPHRVEHFGFRDGLSQPFVDMRLGDPQPGGGRPDRRGTWSPVAPGEIFLHEQDEDGEVHSLPVDPVLRKGSTFLVFRKLEQDVLGFRAFLKRQRRDREGQKALAAQMMGRWPNGSPLVRWPYSEGPAGEEASNNDFRYADQDPNGTRCPLSAHIRRANPRDIGGGDEVRRHRILRRGMSYGGPLLPEDDGHGGDAEQNDEPRGLLFIAANARIDLQFEVVQADWLNGGEFLGQVGLGRCPVSGANRGRVGDSFREAGAVAPIIGLPNFVTTRGGDYFFVPGIEALRQIGQGTLRARKDFELPFRGFSMGDAVTPSLFGKARLAHYARQFRSKKRDVVTAVLPGSNKRISFVGRHALAIEVLDNAPPAGQPTGTPVFSVAPYCEAARAITRGQDLLIGTESGPATSDARKRMATILDEAWRRLASYKEVADKGGLEAWLRDVVRHRLDAALRRTAGARRLDLVADLAVPAAYGVLTDIFGAPGPSHITELGMALPFSKQHIGDLPPDWLAAIRGEPTHSPDLTTMQVWNAVLVADLIGNIEARSELSVVARQAASEMLNHLDLLIHRARQQAQTPRGRHDLPPPRSLLGAFVELWEGAGAPAIKALYGSNPHPGQYYQDVSLILLEILGSTLAVIPLTFASVMHTLFELRIDLRFLIGQVGQANLKRIIYEAERLNPNLPVRMRRCTANWAVPDDDDRAEALGQIKAGDDVAVLISAANLDPEAFKNPFRFSLNKRQRPMENYLLFGVETSEHKSCWGRNRVALPVLEECILAAGRLSGLRRVAGASGEPQKLAGVTIGLAARFTGII